MSSDSGPPIDTDPAASMPPRRRGVLAPTLAILAVLVVAVLALAGFWTEILWFNQLGYTEVLRTRLLTQTGLFVFGGAITGFAVLSSMLIGYRARPIYAPMSMDTTSLERYRESIEPLRRIALFAVPGLLGLFAGSAAAQNWQEFLLWVNGGDFGVTDAQFRRDIGFFVFTLPWLQFVVSLLLTSSFLAGLTAVATHYLYGGLRLQGPAPRVTPAARAHLSIIAAIFLLLRGIDYWLSRYALTTKTTELMTGLSYTDANATLNARSVLAAISVLVAVLVIVAVFVDGWRQLPVYGVVLMLISAIVIGALYPAAIERFRVNPNKRAFELTYIDRNIKATRQAYGLDAVQVQQYSARTTGTAADLKASAESIPGIRLLDPALIAPTFEQLQQNKQYYQFPDSLDIDRYTLNGSVRDSVVAVRELKLSGVPADKRNWVNDHLVYTHGYGFVGAYGNEVTSGGDPVFFAGGIPASGKLETYEPRVYFGEFSPNYSIVGGDSKELDYPDDAAATKEATYSYQGDGGVEIGSLWRRVLYAVNFRDGNILLSDSLNSKSRIMYEREPKERVRKVAPYLSLDGDPYPSVVDGKIVWIIDGYTTSNRYPYSAMSSLESETTDSLTVRSANVTTLPDTQVNYIRNSVKATVDAFDGSVKLYAWDEKDPVLNAWQKIFPSTVKPLSEVSSELMSHLRYPEDLFKVQRGLLGRYHVTDPSAFFSASDFWRVPPEPNVQGTGAAAATAPQPPYYLSVQMPGTDAPSYSLTSTFIPPVGGRNVLKGFLAVDADAGATAGQRREGYGTLRLLQLPTDAIKGPGQMQNEFNSNVAVTRELNILRGTGGVTVVESGNLLTLPMAGGLIYVQPVYVRAKGETSYPLLQRVLVGFGQQIGFAPTLQEALNQVFGGGASGGTTVTPPTEGDGTAAGAAARLQKALTDAQQAVRDGDTALKAGDFTAYGKAQEQLKSAIAAAVAAQTELGQTSSAVTVPSPTPSPSASAAG